MNNEKDDKGKDHAGLDNRLGTPMKKVDGLSCDKKRAESEHLYAFRDDINIGDKDEDENDKKEE